MGAWTRGPTSMSLNDLKDLGKGDTKEQTTGCGAYPGNTTGDLWDKGFRYPQNGEFEWDSDLGSDCWTCDWAWGEECFDAGGRGRGGGRFLASASPLLSTEANVFEFMFENRVLRNERVPAGFFCFSVMKNTNQHFVL